jgi:PAS domain S-box-containing protein
MEILDKLYRSLFENMLDGFAYGQMIYDDSGKPIDWIYLETNSSFEKLTGLKNVKGKRVTEVIPGIKETNPELFEIYAKVALTGKTVVFETEVKPLQRWFKVSVYSMEKNFFTAVFDNITESKKFEQQMQAVNLDLQKFKLAVEYASEHIIITDPDAKIVYANQAASTITGYSVQEMTGQTPRLWGGHMEKSFYEKMWKTIKTDKLTFHAEATNKRKNGEEYKADLFISPILDSAGNIVYFVGIERDITHEKEVDRMKTEFVSLASHQLRTPLTAIKWFLEMMLDGDVGEVSGEQRNFLEKVYESNEKMIELVNSLLNITRIESGRLTVEPIPTKISDLINQVLLKIKALSTQKQMTIKVSEEGSIPLVNLDPKLISNLYENLLENSIKYSPAGSNINISVSVKDKFLISSIQDEGLGIPEAEQKKIFEKFFRASNIVKQNPDGTGLGLYICKAIVESSGGKIWLRSTEGKGTTFFFSLPISGMEPKKGQVSLS